jgi:hypothetical protein
MARWQEVLAELELGNRRNVGMVEDFRTVVADIPRLRAGTGAAHTSTMYSSRAARLVSAMDAGKEHGGSRRSDRDRHGKGRDHLFS